MAESKESKLHADLFDVRKEINALAKGQAETSQKMLELVQRQERLEAELAVLRGKTGK
jgi:small-conductance mechanosensitive channel